MQWLNAKPVFCAGIAAMLTSPAVAQKSHRRPSQQYMTSDPLRQTGRGLYDVVPSPASPYDPAVTGGGSAGYNQSLHDNKW